MGNLMSGFYPNKFVWSRNKHKDGLDLTTQPPTVGGTALQRQTRHQSRWSFHLADRHLQTHLQTLQSPVLCLFLREGVMKREGGRVGAACLRLSQ